MEILLYVGKVSLYWVLFYLCYWLMLRKHTFFQWNRYYLVGSLFIAFALPFIIYPASAPELPVLYEVDAAAVTISTAQEQQQGWLTWTSGLFIIYGIGAILALARLVSHIVLLSKYIRLGEVIELDDCNVVVINSNHVGSFSFFKWIVINQNDYENHFDAIMRHEMAHATQRHSLDILLVELLKVAFWFNPVLLLYKRSLQEIHEYLADAQAPDREYYAKFLVAYALNAPVAALTNHFFKPSQIKNRIRMIYKNRTSKWMLGTYAVAALLITSAALFVAGCENKVGTDPEVEIDKKSATAEKMESVRKIFTVVEKQPEFPGGTKAMYEFLARNIRYPRAASDANVGGRVFLSFVITETGDVEDVQVLKGIGFGCDEEAVRVLSKFPKWIPGKQRGIPVNVKYNLPISFKIEDGHGSEAATSKDEVEIPYFPPRITETQSSDSHIQIRTPDGPISLDEQPMYVLDGEIMEDGDFLKTIPSNDIASVSVLKGASASNIYGERGKNGVVIINMKNSN